MLGKIVSIMDDVVKVQLAINIYSVENLIGKNVIFHGKSKIVGEITDMDNRFLLVHLLGEITGNSFVFGDINKPNFNDNITLITKEELDIIFNQDAKKESIILGSSFNYPNYFMNLDINNFFSNHFAILGNSGSGKSWALAHIVQSLFKMKQNIPYHANLFVFDAYGEYQTAFDQIGTGTQNIRYKSYTTNLNQTEREIVRFPFWLLTLDDIAILLDVNDKRQLPILEKALKLVCLFSKEEQEIIEYKNDIIARTLLDIIFNSKTNVEIRTRVSSILTNFGTKSLNLDTQLSEPGWTRSLRQCLYIDNTGKIANIELVTTLLQTYVRPSLELPLPDGKFKYTMEQYYSALELALVSEGIYTSDSVFDYANILKVRLNYLINSAYSSYFKFEDYVNRNAFIKYMLTTKENQKAQIINFNINYVDDRFAKKLVKIYSKLLFDYASTLEIRASMPFHIILEEAHRYVQQDQDVEILGYNIFERITKEGRKYGVLLGVISQRPSELSETVLSQASNFLIFKMFHPKDLSFVKDIVPNLSTNLSNKLKTLYPGIAISFGTAFKVPVLVKIIKPSPEPNSSSSNIVERWFVHQ